MEIVMISGQDLFNERDRIKASLENSLRRAYDNGMEAAEATRKYRIALRQEVLRLQAGGQPQTNLGIIAKGEEEVARAEFEMNVAEVKYKASNENIMAQKKLFESIEADITREYYRGDQNG